MGNLCLKSRKCLEPRSKNPGYVIDNGLYIDKLIIKTMQKIPTAKSCKRNLRPTS